MSKPKLAELWISESGEIAFIHDDALAALVSESVGGQATTRRASHVEQWADLSEAAQSMILGICVKDAAPWHIDLQKSRWFADMRPVNGPVLGPFETRTRALQMEVAWIQRNRDHVLASFPDVNRTPEQPERDLRSGADQCAVPPLHSPG